MTTHYYHDVMDSWIWIQLRMFSILLEVFGFIENEIYSDSRASIYGDEISRTWHCTCLKGFKTAQRNVT